MKKVPSAHPVHALCPVALEYVPEAHRMLAVENAPLLDWPNGLALQLAEELPPPPGRYVPSGQETATDEALTQYPPAGQTIQEPRPWEGA